MNALIDKDQEHLRLLSIFHYIYGGMIGLLSCFPIVYVIFGIAIVNGVFPQSENPQQQMPAAAGWLFIFGGGLFILLGWTIAGLKLYAGKCLARQTHYTFCLIVAAVECLFVPQGTVLGVFTLLVLLRPSVKPLFESQDAAA